MIGWGHGTMQRGVSNFRNIAWGWTAAAGSCAGACSFLAELL